MEKFNLGSKTSSFFLTCMLVVIAPMLRGSVHLWAETVILMLILTGGLVVLLESVFSVQAKALPSEKKEVSDSIEPQRICLTSTATSPGAKSRTMERQSTLAAVVSLGLLVVVSALLSSHKSLAFEGMTALGGYVILFYVFRHILGFRNEQRWMVYVIIGTGLLLSFLGMLKLFDMNIPGLWEYPDMVRHNYTSLSGPYVNRNHMAGFLDMVIPMMLGLFLTRERTPEMHLGMICLVLFLIVAQAMTLSRGGWTATLGAMGFMMVVLMWQRNFRHKRLLISTVVGIAVVSTILLASTPVVQRINTLIEKDVQENLGGRLRMWDGTRQMIIDHLFTGTGPGTFTEAYPKYQEPGASVLAVYAHNDYLQFMADCGILVVPMMAWLLFLFFRAGFSKMKSRSRQVRGITLGAMGAVVAILIHSFSDFNLHIPANAVLFTALTATVFD